uniref:Uncharacterized protein n=1 Tax=Pararge aegeria TaxID=116150 RepID=S4NG89_9NEOP
MNNTFLNLNCEFEFVLYYQYSQSISTIYGTMLSILHGIERILLCISHSILHLTYVCGNLTNVKTTYLGI